MSEQEEDPTLETVYEHLIGIVQHQNWLNEDSLRIRVEEAKIIKLLKQNQRNWNYLFGELRKLIEEHDGLYSYVTDNLSKRIPEVPIKRKTKRYKEYNL